LRVFIARIVRKVACFLLPAVYV